MSTEASPTPDPNPASYSASPLRGPSKPKENIWVNLVCNAVLPGILLTQLSKPERLGPAWALVVALSIPLGYGVYDLWRRKTWNTFAVIGLVGTLITGLLGLLQVSNFWFAVKEAAIPALLGLAIPMTLNTRQPLIRALLYNDQVLDTDRINQALSDRSTQAGFEALLRWASWVMAGAFMFSAVLNYLLARWIVTAPPGSSENAAQLGKLHWVSWPVIMLPSMAIMMFALFRLLKGLEFLTGLRGDELFHAHHTTKK